MKASEQINSIKSKKFFYKRNIIFLKKLLHERYTKKNIYLSYELKNLEEGFNNFEKILKSYNKENIIINEEKKEEYFDNFEDQFLDFLILVRWSNSSKIHIKLREICNKKSSINFYERESYKILLNMFDEIC